MMQPVPDVFLALRDVAISFAGHHVLQGIDLDVYSGEILSILGQSGSGKSVLLKIMVGLLQPDRGTIVFEGQHVETMRTKELTRHRLKVGMVFQSSALFDSMSVGDNVAYGLREHYTGKMPKSEMAERVAWALKAVGLAGIEAMDPAELSGGMRKRVGIARTIALQPKTILYDDPTAGLDPINAARIGRLVGKLRERLGITSVVVTQDLDTAFRFSDRLALIDSGKIAEAGTPEAMNASSNKVVRDFLTGFAPAEGKMGEVRVELRSAPKRA